MNYLFHRRALSLLHVAFVLGPSAFSETFINFASEETEVKLPRQ